MDLQKLIRDFISHYGDLSGQEHLLELFANCVMTEYGLLHPEISDEEWAEHQKWTALVGHIVAGDFEAQPIKILRDGTVVVVVEAEQIPPQQSPSSVQTVAETISKVLGG